LPASQAELAAASERADVQLAEVKRLEIRAMLTDQTVEELEQQLRDAHSMASTTGQRAEETGRQLGVRARELGQAQDRWHLSRHQHCGRIQHHVNPQGRSSGQQAGVCQRVAP
jgi:hypothetical protein